MSWITPNTDICLLEGVPLDSTYNHTLYFSSASVQHSTFELHIKYTISPNTYQRVERGKLRIAKKYEDVFTCNYMMFKNTSYENKWFYAFIKDARYINDNTTEIDYIIDVIQTWYFDFYIPPCLIDREHTITDVLGENLVPESISSGDMMVQDYYQYNLIDLTHTYPYTIVISYIPNEYRWTYTGNGGTTPAYLNEYPIATDPNTGAIEDSHRGHITNGIYNASMYLAIPIGSLNPDTYVSQVNYIINYIVSRGASITNIQQIPTALWNARDTDGDFTLWKVTVPTNPLTPITYFKEPYNTSVHYTPKNKKLFTSPYLKLIVYNNEGGAVELKWEEFSGTGANKNASFSLQGVAVPVPEVMLIPMNYCGRYYSYQHSSVIKHFIQNTWNEDSFSKWWNENSSSYETSVISTAVSGIRRVVGIAQKGAGLAASISTGNVPAAITEGAGLVQDIANTITDQNLAEKSLDDTLKEQQATPDSLHGLANTDTLRNLQSRFGFTILQMGVTADVARIIDNYFSMYGYACKQVKEPNIRTASQNVLRPCWNYVKTAGCTVICASGKSVPQTDLKSIQSIFNKGITFWRNYNEVGKYNLNNNPVI